MEFLKSLYNEAKYADYTPDEVQMEFYSHVLSSLIYTTNIFFNIFWGMKSMYARLVNFSQLPKIFY